MAAGVAKKSKSALFLIELIIAILFFALSSAVCAQLFAKAHLISQKSSDVTMAVSRAQTAAELLHLGHSESNWESIQRFDAEWNAADGENAVFELKVSGLRQSSGMELSTIEVWRIGAQEPLYTLNTGVFTENLPHTAQS